MSFNLFGSAQKLGKALMLPIAVLPAAALLLRLGQPDILGLPFIPAGIAPYLPFIGKAGGAIFDNLALIFAIGVAIGLSVDGSGAAALSGAVAYLTLTNAVVAINKDINMGVLAGMISGILAAWLYNRYHNIKMPDFLGFFSGKRFVPIAASLSSVVLAGILGFAWPPIQAGIGAVGNWIIAAGTLGTFVYGTLNRLLIPLGLHHVLNSLVWFIFGTYTNPTTGAVVTGDLHRFFAGDPTAGVFMAGFFPIMMFALPAAAFAMIQSARPENRKAVSAVMISIAFTSFLTGITEPIEFSFMFLAPWLYLFHAIMMGASLAVCNILGIHHGFGFSGGAIDFFLNMNLPAAAHPWLIVPVGLGFGVLYYAVFLFAIRKWDLQTPGRFTESASSDTTDHQETADSSIASLAARYFEALGGKTNIKIMDSCITRLRLSVQDTAKIDESKLKKLGASGVFTSGEDVQVIVGTKADLLSNEINRLMKG